jgi:hypothetical protein
MHANVHKTFTCKSAAEISKEESVASLYSNVGDKGKLTVLSRLRVKVSALFELSSLLCDSLVSEMRAGSIFVPSNISAQEDFQLVAKKRLIYLSLNDGK